MTSRSGISANPFKGRNKYKKHFHELFAAVVEASTVPAATLDAPDNRFLAFEVGDAVRGYTPNPMPKAFVPFHESPSAYDFRYSSRECPSAQQGDGRPILPAIV